MDKWIKVKISDLGQVVGGATPSTKKEEYYNGDIAWITPKDLSDFKGRYISRGERNITKAGIGSCSTQLLPKHTILFSSRAPIGYVAIAENELCTNQGFKSVIPNENVDYLFLYYLLKYNKDKIESMGSGTTFKEVSGSTMRNIEIMIPKSTDTQRKIASILDSIDSKIENNQKINNNLLEQAQALFKSWFIEFAPFGYEMPSSWNEGTLQDIAEFSNGYAFASSELLDEEAPDTYHVFKQGHIVKGGGFNSSGTKSWYPRSKATSLGKFVLRKGDILMAMTDMKGNVQILGNTAIMEVDNQYIVNQRVGVLRCKSETGVAFPYLFLLTNSFDFLSDLRGRANSGVQVNLSASAIKNSVVQIAPKQVYEEFNTIVLPLFEAMISNDLENQRLAELRNTLLPKLMSGDLDVSNVEI